jgi:hypothetical protein
MIASDDAAICEQAVQYYFDYLDERSRKDLPPEISVHIGTCQFCQTALRRLSAELTDVVTNGTDKGTSVLQTNLSLHFANVGKLITCDVCKPFLPSLADVTLSISIPTPITVHIDKCQQCTSSLELIQQLRLTHKQLCRLGQLFAEGTVIDSDACSKMEDTIQSYAVLSFSDTSAPVFKHLSQCASCRKKLYQQRKTICCKLTQAGKAVVDFPCQDLLPADIFDYCIPYGIDPDKDQYTMFRQALTSHISTCSLCFSKLQQLHEVVYGILDSSKSGVVTCYMVKPPEERSVPKGSDDMYSDWPIEVKVLEEICEKDTLQVKGASAGRGSGTSSEPKKKDSLLTSKALGTLIAAAAAVLIVAVLLFNGSTVKATGFSEIFDALEKIKNIYLATFVPAKKEPIQETWISQTLNAKAFKTSTQLVLWDVADKSRNVKDLTTGSITLTNVNSDVLGAVKETMNIPWNLLPFASPAELPPDYTWQIVSAEEIEVTIQNTEVYDSTWADKKLDGSILDKKWRGYIDIETKLPRKIEYWEKHLDEQNFVLTTSIKVDYPTVEQIQAVITEAGF